MEKIISVPVEKLIPYERNAKLHPESQIEALAKMFQEFGFDQPIVVDKDMVIVKGHGRRLAALRAGMKEVPVIVRSDLSAAKVRASRIADNKIAETDWETEKLASELKILEQEDEKLLELLGIADAELEELLKSKENNWGDHEGGDNVDLYTKKIKIPLYEPKGEKPALGELVNTNKTLELTAQILASNLSQQEKEFLIVAASRHSVFNYQNIAEYYCHASKEFQLLAEKSALVIIDFEKAIENGFLVLSKELTEAYNDDTP